MSCIAEYSHQQLDSSVIPDTDVFWRASKAARQFACDLRAQHPGWAGYPAIPGSPADQVIRAAWDHVCGSNPNQPPPPSAPYSGGQCPTIYRVRSRYYFNDPSGSFSELEVPLSGKLGGFSFRNGRFGWAYYLDFGVGTPSPSEAAMCPAASSIADFKANILSCSIISVVRADGNPDNCGDPAPQYPPDSYLPPADADRTAPYLPPSPTAPGRGWKFSIPFVWVDANFNVKVDVGGVTLKFDLGGVKINLGNKDGGNGDPGSFDGKGDFPDDYATKDDVAGAKNAADGAKNAADGAKNAADGANKNDPTHPRNDPSKQNQDPRGENDPKEESGIARLLYVDVTVTQRPTNAKSQWGAGSPDVYYCGWFEFKSKGRPLPREPIHFLGGRFAAPVGADGFAYTLYNGFKSTHVITTAKG